MTTDIEPEVLGGRSIDWLDGSVVLIDQTRLPGEHVALCIDTVPDLVDAIVRLAVRGAPAIGVAGAFGVALAVRDHGSAGADVQDAIASLRAARPTAVNLARMVDRAAGHLGSGFERVLEEAGTIRDEEIAASISIGEYGADLVLDLVDDRPVRVMTICNTGGLAAVERGTALAVAQTLHERGVLGEVVALETRPLLQGARLTTWELGRMGAPHRLVVDSAGPFLLARGHADVVLTGADRVTANGDTANKIGTFSLALGARHAGVAFVVVAPESTIDGSTADGGRIEIEGRRSDEITSFGGIRTAPEGTEAINPAFDVTPVDLVSALVTDRRVVEFAAGATLTSTPMGARRAAGMV